MKLKTSLLTLFFVLLFSASALAESISFTAADLNEYDWDAQLASAYKVSVDKDGGWLSRQSGFGDKYASGSAEYWGDDNKYKGFGNNSGNIVLTFGYAQGIVLESLEMERSAGTWFFTHTGGGTTIINVDPITAGDDFVALYGHLIDYSLGGITSLCFTPGAWPNADFRFYSMGFSPASSVPLPGALWLMGTGLAGLMACRRKNR